MAIAVTLFGAISPQLSLYYLTNHPDDDMRKYSYEIINATVSIFSAVLVFQSFNDMVETFFLEGKSLEFVVLVDMLHLLVWFWILQLALATISGVIGQFLLQRITDVIRDGVSRDDDGRLDEYAKLWDEETEDFERKILNRSFDVFRVVMRGSTFLIGLIVLPVFACADKGDYTVFFRFVLSP